MSKEILIIVLILHLLSVNCNYLEVETVRKPNHERTNVVNKGTWLRNKHREPAGAAKLEEFIFRPNSLDVDNILQSDFNVFGENNGQSSPLVTSYVERNKRANFQHRRHKKSIKCKTGNCLDDPDNLIMNESKFISKLKPSSVFNDYPYEIAVLLDNTRKELEKVKNETRNLRRLDPIIVDDKNYTINSTLPTNDAIDIYNVSESDVSIPKSNGNDYESKIIKKVDFIEEVNNTQQTVKNNRDIFDKHDRVWHQKAPVPDINYKTPMLNREHMFNPEIKKNNENISIHSLKIPPKEHEETKFKMVTDRGLVKVLSMLTKTFKKIMRQHDDIKDIHKKMHGMNKDFLRKVEGIVGRFNEFDQKYATLMKFNEQLKLMEERLKDKEQVYRNKETELSKNLIEFETQQKKFLTQQRQFYNIQKLMLAQNEKISAKQNLIAKTQSEISHRQNNFARILKKAKQIYIDRHATPKITSTFTKIDNETDHDSEVTHTTTAIPQTTESVKINLFSIPSTTRIQNQDHLLLSEKDEQPVDDLVYKYYFNNTFLDTLMKNKVLANIVAAAETSDLQNVKSKRNEESAIQTTILLPVKGVGIVEQILNQQSLTRNRRWIHHSRKNKKHGHGKAHNEITGDAKKVTELPETSTLTTPNAAATVDSTKNSPFLVMATNFCNGIGQNTNQQVLDWCVEKALRRLSNIDTRMPVPVSTPVPVKPSVKPQRLPENDNLGANQAVQNPSAFAATFPSTVATAFNPTLTSTPSMPSTLSPYSIVRYTAESFDPSAPWTPSETNSLNMFFPDNDQLETNLKKYEIKPDLEGNVYFEGSLHASDMIMDKESDGFSDIMQIESNSRYDIDPATFDLQAKRRAYLRRLKDYNAQREQNMRPGFKGKNN